jgi:hypothetical protein
MRRGGGGRARTRRRRHRRRHRRRQRPRRHCRAEGSCLPPWWTWGRRGFLWRECFPLRHPTQCRCRGELLPHVSERRGESEGSATDGAWWRLAEGERRGAGLDACFVGWSMVVVLAELGCIVVCVLVLLSRPLSALHPRPPLGPL